MSQMLLSRCVHLDECGGVSQLRKGAFVVNVLCALDIEIVGVRAELALGAANVLPVLGFCIGRESGTGKTDPRSPRLVW